MPRGPKREVYCDDCTQRMESGLESKDCCKECKSKRRSHKAAKIRTERGLPPYGSGLRSPFCSICGKDTGDVQHSYCNPCKREAARIRRLNNKKLPNFMQEERARRTALIRENAIHRLKVNCRTMTLRMIKAGILERKPCEVCGKTKVDAHHDDYTKPRDVRWLCRSHHLKLHRQSETI